MCSVLPPSSNVGVICCTAPGLFSVCCFIHSTTTRTTFSEQTSGTLLICHCLQCNQSCHQFVAKHTLMSLITGLGYFVSWGNCNDHIFAFFFWMLSFVNYNCSCPHTQAYMTRKVIMCATFFVYVRSIESKVGYWPLSKPGLFFLQKALKHNIEYFVSGCLKQDEVPGNRFFIPLIEKKPSASGFLYLWLRKSASASGGFAPWPPPGAFCGPRTSTFRTIPISDSHH